MLRPGERQHLLELLRPPVGSKLDIAIGTTFSLDLLSALMLPLSFAFFDWEHEDGEPVADPLALMEALRCYGDRFTVFCQSGQIRLPRKYQPLVAFLEPCIYEVKAPDTDGVFHPKVWALRFIGEDSAIRYRVLCLSRNLTFDRSWDTVVALDGELTDRTNAIAANHPLADLIAALPTLARQPMARQRRQGIEKIARELRRVRFTWPAGFDGKDCKFWVAGLSGKTTAPFGTRRDKALIISPFVSSPVVRDFLNYTEQTHLVSRPECLQELPRETLQDCESVRFLAPELAEQSDEEFPITTNEVLNGLHAKLFVIDRGWNASVFTGSFNATTHAFRHNVEFMVELVGRRSQCGVDQFLLQTKGEARFADMLKPYDFDKPQVPFDTTTHELDGVLQAVKGAIDTALPCLIVTPSEEVDLFEVRLNWMRAPHWPKASLKMFAWPITQQAETAQTLIEPVLFSRLSFRGLTPLIAFSVTAKIADQERTNVFVMNLPMQGAPADRHDRIVRSLIGTRDQLLRYILFLLAGGDEGSASSGELRRLLESSPKSSNENGHHPHLLETMLRALHRSPEQLQRVSSLLDVLRGQEGHSDLLSEEFQKIWEPIWQTARKDVSK